MSSSKKFFLLIITLIMFCYADLAARSLDGFSTVVINQAAVKAPVFHPSASIFPFNISLLALANLPQSSSVCDEELLYKKFVKHKKKFKRSLSCSSGLKHPTRSIMIIPPNIFFKESYSKPHFLSHLHRFLFRLTPF